eukprot:scaffold1370_cov271-Pinguiococcus_pyrenoidosus.AAC.5
MSRLAVHPSSLAALAVSAYTVARSPARRGANSKGISRPDAFFMAATISRTLFPRPGLGVALGQVHHVNVVPHARAVRGVVVVAEDAELLSPPDGDLAHVGHEVVGGAMRVFADEPRRVGAHGVEISQDRDPPVLALGAPREVAEDLLNHELGPAVGVGDAVTDRRLLGDGHGRIAVDRGAGGEHEGLAVDFLQHLQQRHGGLHVVLVVEQRQLHRLAHGLEPREVDASVHLRNTRQNLAHVLLVPQVRLEEVQRVALARELRHARQRLGRRVAQIVQHGDLRRPERFRVPKNAFRNPSSAIPQQLQHRPALETPLERRQSSTTHLVAGLQQHQAGVAADVAGAPSHQAVLSVPDRVGVGVHPASTAASALLLRQSARHSHQSAQAEEERRQTGHRRRLAGAEHASDIAHQLNRSYP